MLARSLPLTAVGQSPVAASDLRQVGQQHVDDLLFMNGASRLDHRGFETRVPDRRHGRAVQFSPAPSRSVDLARETPRGRTVSRSEEHTSELQSQSNLVCRLLLEKKKKTTQPTN